MVSKVNWKKNVQRRWVSLWIDVCSTRRPSRWLRCGHPASILQVTVYTTFRYVTIFLASGGKWPQQKHQQVRWLDLRCWSCEKSVIIIIEYVCRRRLPTSWYSARIFRFLRRWCRCITNVSLIVKFIEVKWPSVFKRLPVNSGLTKTWLQDCKQTASRQRR